MMNQFWDRDHILVINADDFFADPPAVARRRDLFDPLNRKLFDFLREDFGRR